VRSERGDRRALRRTYWIKIPRGARRARSPSDSLPFRRRVAGLYGQVDLDEPMRSTERLEVRELVMATGHVGEEELSRSPQSTSVVVQLRQMANGRCRPGVRRHKSQGRRW
jgi:hypothetical protein